MLEAFRKASIYSDYATSIIDQYTEVNLRYTMIEMKIVRDENLADKSFHVNNVARRCKQKSTQSCLGYGQF